ncbi:Serine/threonine protein phosphatase PrpC [Variovorax sp. NFACC28]|nr:Serine/threonine protein phosphatase PrpC [Variovorax sp. NFACC28]SEG99160.1 Serine/threonine protein phosphatase PrpC [Variovorax sp. NFACC29]SFE17862.1 Serine/threonine protein phosphatase PrpC [Variovorax sp. NFACC26]SFH23592.1 Serine/threonine protein phosphatase PrpC [Variovorax sp. NFACC27]
MAPRNPLQLNLPSMTPWLEEVLSSMPSKGRHGLKVINDLAFGFTDDRETEKGNQDRLAVAYCLDPLQSGEKWFFAGICDGVGGEAQGEAAASLALSEIISHLCVCEKGSLEGRLDTAIVRAHREVKQRFQKRSATTFAGVLVSERQGFAIGSVGDSRIYSVSPEGVAKLSQDDTLVEMLRRQSPRNDEKKIREAIEALTPRWRESLGQAIGSDLALEPRISSWPQIEPDVGCLLCTDGVWKPTENVLAQVSRSSPGRTDLARRLLALTDHLGGTDNATAIVLPDLEKVQQWLRAPHSIHEAGLVHIVLAGEGAVVPWALFRRTESPRDLRESRISEQEVTGSTELKDEVPVKPKRRGKSKPGKAVKEDDFQMTIVEGPNDDASSSPSAIPEKR